jgi:DNA-binding XRE family transcriptional regulator
VIGHHPFSELRTKDPVRLARIAALENEVRASLGLARLREEAGLTQQQLAERMAVSQEAVCRLEGAQDMRLSSISRYVRALGGEVAIQVRMPDQDPKILGRVLHEPR